MTEDSEDKNKNSDDINVAELEEKIKQAPTGLLSKDKIKELEKLQSEAMLLGIPCPDLEKTLKENKHDGTDTSYQSDDMFAFNSGFDNGKFFAKGTDGSVVEATNFYDLNCRIAQSYKNLPKYKGKIPTITFTAGKNEIGGVSVEQCKKDFARAFIMNGVIPKGDLPQDKEFWQQLKRNI